MRKKLLFPKITAIIIAISLVLSMCIVPNGSGVVRAEEEANPIMQEEDFSGDVSVDEKDIIGEEISGMDAEAAEQAVTNVTDVNTLDNAVEEPTDEEEGETEDPAEEEFDVKLLFGNPELPDEDAVVLTFLGDGFQKEQLGDPNNTTYIPDTTAAKAEDKKFWNYAQTAATYMMETSPWDEFKDCVKIYGIGVISEDTGAKGCDAKTAAEAATDERDTYFKSEYWSGGMQRALVIGDYGRQKVAELKEKYINSDYEIILVNSEEIGGTGGSICVFSVDPDVYECTLHELGHTVGKLADEYWPGRGSEKANMTSNNDPETIKWNRFLGKNGVGIYEYGDGGNGWYRPSQNCKMQFLGKQYPFCEVCKEGFRDAISELTNVQHISFQLYADDFYEKDELPDMSEYFILRKGSEKKNLQELDKSSYTLTYYKDGEKLDAQPITAGTYTVKATFTGDDTFEPCELEGTYTIGLPNAVTITADNKTYDGSPIEVTYDVDTEKLGITEYDAEVHYTGTDKFAIGESGKYDSDNAPVKPGEYMVNVKIYNKDRVLVSEKNKSFTILFKVSQVVNHEDTANYPGASSLYNNKTIPIVGEGFTVEEQDEFEECAEKLIEYMRNTEPYKEADFYFNYTTVETVSDNSGIGISPNGTYFQLTYDESGKITPTIENATAAHSVAYEQANHYYQSVIIIVNDKNAKESAVVDPNAATSIKHRAIFITPDENGMEFAAREVLNRIADMDKGYVASTDEEKAELRARLLDKIVYGGTPSSRPGRASKLYAPILSTAYNETFIADGKPVDLSSYFMAYAGRTPIPEGKVSYDITYYADNNGEMGEQLSEAPSEPGTYYALAVTKTDEGKNYASGVDLSEISGYSNNINFMRARGLTSFTISENTDKPAEPEIIKVKSIKLSGISHKIAAGKKIKLKATISPANASNKNIVWSTSNSKYATVKNGVVTTKKAGAGKTVKITAKSADGAAKATYTIKIMKGAVKKIAISGSKSVKAGKSVKLKAKVTTTKGTANKKVKWTSSNTKYATVSSTGKVKASKSAKGKKVKITATATDGSGKKKTVTIKIQ